MMMVAVTVAVTMTVTATEQWCEIVFVKSYDKHNDNTENHSNHLKDALDYFWTGAVVGGC